MTTQRDSAFADRLRSAPRDGGFAMGDWWIWGSSVVRGDDGDYHVFASRWSKDVPFSPGWTSNSHIVRGTSPTPEGPYEFVETVIAPGDEIDWDRMSHNPSIVRAGDAYLLFYYGCGYDGPRPSAETPRGVDRHSSAVGLASAPSVNGPWTRHGPIVSNQTNAVPVVDADGSVRLYTRSGDFEMSVYEADHWSAVDDYRLLGERVLAPVEDQAVWRSASGEYRMVGKDMHGHSNRSGYVDSYAGFHATSPDGIRWTVSDSPRAYPHRTEGDRELVVEWDDDTATTFANAERAQVLVEDGEVTHLFLAVMEYAAADTETVVRNADLPSHARWPADARCICIPVGPALSG